MHTLTFLLCPSYTRRLDRHLSRMQRTRIDVVHTSNSLGIEYQSLIVLRLIEQTPPIVESGTRLVAIEGLSAS